MKGFDWVLAISLAGITALEWVSGDMMGVEMVQFEKLRKDAQDNFKRESQFEKERYDSEYKLWLSNARKNMGLWKIQYEKWNENNYSESGGPEQPISENQTPSENNIQTPQNEISTLSKAEQCYYWVKKITEGEGRLPTAKEVSEKKSPSAENGYSIAYASAAVNRYILENSKELLKRGMVTQDKVEKAKVSMKKVK